VPARTRKIPKPRRHATDQLVATFNGKDECFGKADTHKALAAYDRFVAEWLASVHHALEYYVKNGKQTREVWAVKASLRVARELDGLSPAAEFGPLALKADGKTYCAACQPSPGARTRRPGTTARSRRRARQRRRERPLKASPWATSIRA
jgi:hypothetical protein